MLQYTKEVISLSEKRTHYPTIKAVAKLANTSTATVSYILNEDASRPISQELRARVLAAVKELNYTKSAVASNLRTCKSGVVFILIPQFSNIYFTRVCEKIEDVVSSFGFLPIICDTRENPERELKLIKSAVTQRADGIILGPTSQGWSNTSLLRERNIPYVIIGRELVSEDNPAEAENTYYVGDDSYEAGFKAGRCLAENGHKHIGVIDWKANVSSTLGKKQGFYDAVMANVTDGGYLETESSSVLSTEEGYRMTKTLLQRTNPTALFYGYHRHALGGVQYLNEIGYTVPDDISVIMVGTPSWARISSPKYHMIFQHEDWVGEMAGRILMKQLTKENSSLLLKKKHICACSLVEGGSVKNLEK